MNAAASKITPVDCALIVVVACAFGIDAESVRHLALVDCAWIRIVAVDWSLRAAVVRIVLFEQKGQQDAWLSQLVFTESAVRTGGVVFGELWQVSRFDARSRCEVFTQL